MLDAEELVRDLTPEQREAVTTVDGPLLVIAAAGSGKTRVLTRRVAYLISQGIDPGSILAITFTNKAAGEMKARVGVALGRKLRDWGRLEEGQPCICTFHSLCMRILRQYGPRIGLPGLTIFDTSDQTKVVKEAMKLLDISSTNFQPGVVLNAISGAKNELLSPAQFRSRANDFFGKQVARVYEKYQSMLEAQGALDFDDLLLRTVRAFREHHDVLAELQDRFQYLMIDEYQDTNNAQYVLSTALAMKRRNLCVVGDPDQSIYAWRGADIKNILDFKKDYPDAHEVKLETNYRSTKTILSVADTLIKHNSNRIDKRLMTDNPEGEKVQLKACVDEHDEADVVTRELKALQAKGTPFGKMAVFYRMNSLSRVMEDALRRSSVPYVMVRGTAFYDRREIKDVLGYLRVIANVLDEVSIDRIANTPPRGISDATLDKLRAHAVDHAMSLFAAMVDIESVAGLTARAKNAVKTFVGQIRGWQKLARLSPSAESIDSASGSPDGAPEPDWAGEEVEEIYDEIGGGAVGAEGAGGAEAEGDLFSSADRVAARSAPLPPPKKPTEPPPVVEPTLVSDKGALTALMERIVKESGLEALYVKEGKSSADTGSDPLSNVNELISSAAEFDREYPEGTLDEYLSQVALVSDVDGLKEGGVEGGAVTMMTLHAAKGLEFPVVAMIGLEDGILPHSRAAADFDQLEEERRLCFVGITRAEQRLILTKAAHRTIRGVRERTIASKFLKELPADRLVVEDRTGNAPSGGLSGGGSAPFSRYATTHAVSGSGSDGRRVGTTTYRQGQLVRHPTFGMGRITELSGSGQQTRCVIDFNSSGRKTLILEYTKLEVINP